MKSWTWKRWLLRAAEDGSGRTFADRSAGRARCVHVVNSAIVTIVSDRRGDRNDRGPRGDREDRPKRERRDVGDMELYRIEVGRDDGVEVRHIVGAIANEGDISSRYIG